MSIEESQDRKATEEQVALFELMNRLENPDYEQFSDVYEWLQAFGRLVTNGLIAKNEEIRADGFIRSQANFADNKRIYNKFYGGNNAAQINRTQTMLDAMETGHLHWAVERRG